MSAPAPAAPDNKEPKESKKPTSAPTTSPSSPSQGKSTNRSSSRNKDPASQQSSPKKPSNRGGSNNGGKGRRASAGASSAAKMDKSAEKSAPAAGSEGLASLKNIISELKDAPASSGASSSPSAPAPSSSPSRNKSHRKNGSGQAPTISAPPPPAPSSSSTLNPNAGGFQPTSLGSITDMMDEGLVTPTASHFDLMTGMPRGALGIGGFRSPPLGHQAQFGAPLPGSQQDDGFGGNRAFAFPGGASPAQIAAAQQQQQQQFMLQQQQQFQLAQMQMAAASFNPNAGILGAPGGVGQSTANDLMAEQMAIQAQLENLRAQQENLLARFGDMQMADPSVGANVAPPASQPPQSGPAHRRGQSQQHQTPFGGAMGSFGIQGAPPTASGLPKGHGRRHSVNTTSNAQQGQQQQQQQGHHKSSSSFSSSNLQNFMSSPALSQAGGFSPNMAMSPPMGSFGAGGGSLGGGFQFPNNGGGPRQNQGEADFNASGGGGFGGGRHNRSQSGSTSSLGGWSINNHNTQSNLAEAQAHLQQLATYRASSGHSRVPSFGMSTLGGSGPGQLAMAGYGGGLPQQSGNQQTRKSLFAPYLPQASIPPLLAAGKLVIGVLRVNKRNRSDAYVATDVLDADIYICGSKDRNRALEGDVVAVELLDVDEVWGTKKEKEEKKRKKEENASFDPRATRDIRKQDKKKDDVEVEGQGLMLFEEEEVNDDQKPQFAGHVVAVVERAPGQLFSGMLGVLRPSSAATQQKQDAERKEREGVDLGRGNNHAPQQPPKIIWFRPTDKRVPLIAIPTEQAPADFVDRADKYADRLFVACIKRWPITSLHPFGTLVEELGTIGDIETETQALLKDCNFSSDDFSESVAKCLPPTPFTIPERETSPEVRKDFRKHRVFTIDPETAKDLDDALHIVKNEDGTYEIGVHIADVTHFVKPNTALDREARKRATTVYLVQRAVPMLPPTLSEELCSLNSGVDKLCFSVVFTMAEDGKVLNTWFGKTIINSVAKLAYKDAQTVIDGGSISAEKVPDKELREGMEKDIIAVANVTRQLRARRFENGALKIDNVKVKIGLDESGLPADCSQEVRGEANELIEELALLANISVAAKIAAGLPDQALLRRHEPPIDRRLNAFVERIHRLGIDLDGSSAGALMKSFDKVTEPNSRVTLQHLSTKGMMRAKYFCAGVLDIAKYHHYALNFPVYTHFTSPIRRYADIMVHRQLEAVLLNGADVKFTLDTEAVSKVAQTCNAKKDAARLAQEQSAHLFLCHLIHDLTERYGPVIRTATVIGVLDEAFDVLVTEFGIEKRVHVNDLPIENVVYDEHDNSLGLYWKKGQDVLQWLAESQNDAHLLRVRQQAVSATTSRAQDEKALFEDDEEEEGEERRPRVSGAAVAKSGQYRKSQEKAPLKFEGVEKTSTGHHVQTVRELQSIPVIVVSDITKSPPVLKVLGVNPFAQ